MASNQPSRPRSRAVVLLVSCGLCLLYFDLLTSMPGCTDPSTNGGSEADAAVGNTYTPDSASVAVDSSSVVQPDSALEDAPTGDAVAADAPSDSQADALVDGGSLVDGPDLLDASVVDAPFVDAPFGDAPDFTDAPDFIDAGIPDAPDFTDAPIDFLDASPDA